MAKNPKRPRDPVQLAKFIGDIATGQTEDAKPDTKDMAAADFTRAAGEKGGKSRAARLSPAERSAIARAGAVARWGKK